MGVFSKRADSCFGCLMVVHISRGRGYDAAGINKGCKKRICAENKC